jgi:AraC-like DNA-binding protein
LSTRDPDVAAVRLSELYSPERPLTFSGAGERFLCDVRDSSLGSLGAGRVRYTARMRTELPRVDYFLTSAGVRGACRYRVGREEVDLTPSAVFRYPNDASLVACGKGVELTSVRLPLSVLERVAVERFGTPAADLRFEGLTPVSAAKRRDWLRLMRFVDAQLGDPTSAVTNPMVEAALAELVAASALTTFPNTTLSAGYLPGPGYVAPATVRRAVAFIDGHASLPITVSDVADAACVGPRALQLAFSRHLGMTPKAYVRRVRLEAAHRELQAADPTAGDTVAAIALRWGFPKPDRFAAAYRTEFGVLPSHTLRH